MSGAAEYGFEDMVDDVPPKAKAKSRPADNKSDDDLLSIEWADELGDKIIPADELIERTVTRGAMSVVYGDSNTGKTFFAIDALAAVCLNAAWMGRRVHAGMIVYLAAENPQSVILRLHAYQRHHGVLIPNFAVIKSPINLFDSDADTELVIKHVLHFEQERGVKCEVVLGDTLARLAAGANENSGEAMSAVMGHADRIRNRCNTHFSWIHHSGKDAAKGARGWSGIRAAIDTEIEITVDPETDTRAAEITKQRDLPGKGDRIGFRLQSVELGVGKWGQPISSCVVVGTDAPPKVTPGRRPSEIAGAISEFLTSKGAGAKKRELVDHFDGRYPTSSIYRELRKMQDAGRVHVVAGVYGLRKG